MRELNRKCEDGEAAASSHAAAVNRPRVDGSKELIQLVSQESSFFNHIITAERPPGSSRGAVQGSAQAEAELCLGSEQRREAGTLQKSQTG